jgi:hypothetical protein
MNIYAKNVAMSLRCLSLKVMSLLARHAAIKNLQKRCLLSDSRWASNLNQHQRDHQGQGAQPVAPRTARRVIDPPVGR